MSQLSQLLIEVADARARFISEVRKLTEEQAQRKPEPAIWSAVDNTEHLYWAEHGGIWGMWRAYHAKKAGTPVWEGEMINQGLPIETIIARTWREKEQVPAIAAPRMGGSAAFWLSAFASLQQPLTDLANGLANEDLENIIHPHVLSALWTLSNVLNSSASTSTGIEIRLWHWDFRLSQRSWRGP